MRSGRRQLRSQTRRLRRCSLFVFLQSLNPEVKTLHLSLQLSHEFAECLYIVAGGNDSGLLITAVRTLTVGSNRQ